MRKTFFVFIVIFLSVPFIASAFSFRNIIDFGKKLIHIKDRSIQVGTKEETNGGEVVFEPALSFDNPDQKFENWRNAFENKDIDRIIRDSRNLYFTEAELNQFFSNDLASMDNPPVRDAQVCFGSDIAKFSGYSMVKNLSGQFYLEIKIAQENNQVNLEVVKTRYRKIYFPSFIAESILRSQMKDIMDFLQSSPNYCLEIIIGDGFVKLNYENINN